MSRIEQGLDGVGRVVGSAGRGPEGQGVGRAAGIGTIALHEVMTVTSSVISQLDELACVMARRVGFKSRTRRRGDDKDGPDRR